MFHVCADFNSDALQIFGIRNFLFITTMALELFSYITDI